MPDLGLRLLTRRDVLAKARIGKSQLFALIKSGDFPQPVKFGERNTRWRSDEIDEWIESVSARRAAA